MMRVPDWTRRRRATEGEASFRESEAPSHDSSVLSYSNLPPGQSGVAVEVMDDSVRVMVPSSPFVLEEKSRVPLIIALAFFAILPGAAVYFWNRDRDLFLMTVTLLFGMVVSLIPPIVRSGRLTSVDLLINREWVVLSTRRFGLARVRRWSVRFVRDIDVHEIARGNQFVTRVSAGQIRLRFWWRPALRLVTLDSYDEAEDIADHVRRLLSLPKPGWWATLFRRKTPTKHELPELRPPDRV